MASMAEMYNIARDKQKVQENEYNPMAGALNSMMQGLAKGWQMKQERPAKEADMFLKLLEIAEKQGEMKRQEEIDRRRKEMYEQYFGGLGADNLKTTTDKTGKGIYTPGGKIQKMEDTHEKSFKYDSKTGGVDVELKPEKSGKDELSLYTSKKEIEYKLKQKYGKVDANAIALEINRLCDPYRDFGKEVSWKKMRKENPKLYQTVQMLYEMHRKIRTEQFNPDDPLGISDLDLEE